MDESIGTGKDDAKRTAGEADLSMDDHPLFMTRIPSAKDFTNNALLSALAALIDEDEEERNPGPHRRQRQKVRSAPWTAGNPFSSALKNVTPSCNSRQLIRHGVSQQATRGFSDPGHSRRVPAEDENEEGQVGHPPYRGGMHCEVELPKETPEPAEEQNSSSSLGELQICMRLFSMK